MQKSRKKFWIVFTSVIASIVLVGLVCGLATRLKTVTVEFRARASSEYTMLEDGVLDKVANAGEFNRKKSLLFMNFDENIEKIEKSNPYIKVEQVVRHFPNIVKIYVSERIPRYRVVDKDDSNKWYILDVDFKVIDVVIGGEDETYAVIDDGSWRSNTPYETIHRIASSGLRKGVLESAVQFAKSRMNHLRIDTHHDNLVMQHLVEKYGFQRRGIIYVQDHSPRIAYDWIQT